jgi:hypothetical protein
MLLHPGFSLDDVRIEDVLPAQRALVVAGLIEKNDKPLGFQPSQGTCREYWPSVCRQNESIGRQAFECSLRSITCKMSTLTIADSKAGYTVFMVWPRIIFPVISVGAD